MPAQLSSRTTRLVLFAAPVSLLISSAAGAQDREGYPPPPTSSYASNGYALAPTDGPYGQAVYVGGPFDSRMALRRQAQQADAAAAPQAPALVPAPPVSAATSVEAANAAPPPAIVPPKPAAPTSVALSHQVVEAASAYLAYMKKASAIEAGFKDGAGVAKEVRTGAAYEPKQFEEGAIAYAAIVALQEPAFIEGVRSAAGGDGDRAQQIAASVLANPASAVTFPGADAAAARASAALRLQGDKLMDAGLKVKQSAYDVQHSVWSKADVLNPEQRLAGAKTLSATRLTPARDETEKLLKLVLAEQGSPAYPGEGASSPVVSRGLALAALAVLGQAGEGSAERVAPLMAEEKGGECLHMAKLNLFQCLAVAGPHYEDIFCLGQHAMMDTAQCVIKASGVTRPVMTASAATTQAAAPVQVAATVTPAPQDYWVPLGGGSTQGVAQGVSEASRK